MNGRIGIHRRTEIGKHIQNPGGDPPGFRIEQRIFHPLDGREIPLTSGAGNGIFNVIEEERDRGCALEEYAGRMRQTAGEAEERTGRRRGDSVWGFLLGMQLRAV